MDKLPERLRYFLTDSIIFAELINNAADDGIKLI